MQGKLLNFVLFPRYLVEEYLQGSINFKELFYITFIRANADPYGVTKTSLDALAIDFKEKKNTVTKTLRSLKRRKYLDYDDRPGRRGTFQIHLDFWKLPDKSIKERWEFYTDVEIKQRSAASVKRTSSTSQSLPMPNQRSISRIGACIPDENTEPTATEIIGTNTYTKNNKDIELTSFVTQKRGVGIPPDGNQKGAYYDTARKIIVETD